MLLPGDEYILRDIANVFHNWICTLHRQVLLIDAAQRSITAGLVFAKLPETPVAHFYSFKMYIFEPRGFRQRPISIPYHSAR